MKLDYCYHTHTYRCGHAQGTEEEYALKAIEAGIKVLGFSDHIFYDDIHQPGIRGDYQEIEDYISTVNVLKEKYKKQIEIHVGFECEYLDYKNTYYSKLLTGEIEYLILGNHCSFNEDGSVYWYCQKENQPEGVDRYVDSLIKGMASGLFSYVAHPDLFIEVFQEFDERCERLTRKICEASITYDMPLEINLAHYRKDSHSYSGYDKHLSYPDDNFWRIVGEYGCKVYLGIDAHNPCHFENTDFKAGFKLIKKYKLNYQKRLKF